MARGINKVILVGNLGHDPSIRYMPNGKPVANLSVATSESWTDRQSGDKQERTEWHTVVLFEKLAEVARDYVHKGSQVYIEGSLRTRKWQDKEGKDRYSTEIVGRELQMLGGRNQRGEGDASHGASAQNTQSTQQAESGGGGFDDDIPFAPFEAGTLA